MPGSDTTSTTGKRNQDIIFGTIVFVGAVLVFMLIYSATRVEEIEKQPAEPSLSPNHEETLHVGNNIPPQEREKEAQESVDGKKAPPYGETKWNKNEVNRETEKKSSTYEREEKVVKPEKAGGAQ